MRLIILFLLLPFVSESQIIRANPFYVGKVSSTFLLDQYPNAAAAYSLRKLKSSYTGNAIRVRRDSTGNAETDIGFTANGDLDTVALKNHCRNNNCAVTTWYDQSTYGRNLTNTTAASQPRIMTTGTIERRSGDLAVRFDGSNDVLFNTTTGFEVNNVTQYAVSSRGNTADVFRVIFATGILTPAIGFGFYYASSTDVNFQNTLYQQIRRDSVVSIGAYTNTLNENTLIFGIGTSSTDYTYFNGGNEQSQAHSRPNGNSNQRISIGARYIGTTAALFLNGTVTEVVFWNANESSNRTGIETNINNYYSIYSPTPRWAGASDRLLDSFPNAAAAYSIRNLKKSYTGPLIKVRRSSDNAEDDIYGDVNGNLDTAWIKTFAGSGDAFITTWYNQGDSTAVNFTQTTAASQPRIMTSGVIERRAGEPTIRFDVSGTSDFMDVASSTVKFNYLHKGGQAAVFAVFQAGLVANPNALYFILNNNGGGAQSNNGYGLYYNDRSSDNLNNAISSTVTRGVNATNTSFQTANNYFASDTLALISNLLDNSTGTAANRNILYRNGTNEQKLNTNTSAASTGNASHNIRIGRVSTLADFPLNGFISEIILYPTDQTSNRTGIETNINNYYGLW